MKEYFISFLLLCALSGCTPAPVPSTQTTKQTVTRDYSDLYEKAKKFVLVVEYFADGSWQTLGTAFVIKFNNKQYVVTAGHVYDKELLLRIRDSKGNVLKVKNGKIAKDNDIAILELDGRLLFTDGLDLAKKNPEIGTEVFHIGNPLGLAWSFTSGVVSQYDNGDLVASTPIAPGSSGGILINKKGQLVGIAVAILPGWSQFNYYEPIETLLKEL